MFQVDLTGKVALVTGGSRGLGRAMVLGLARAGADVVIASRKLDNCETVAAEVSALGRRALAVSAHAGQLESLDALLDKAYEHFGHVDVLINNAGTNPVTAGLSDLTPELYEKVFDVNTKGPWYLASRAAPRMARHGGGSIINVISVGCLKPSAYQGFYGASKAALNTLTKVMAAEWASLGIRVNALAPGGFHSDMFDNSAKVLPGFADGLIAKTLQKRIAATEEILGSVLYLASDMSSFTTGSTLVADGGYLLG
ncbi:MAG: glucose 1-dehydrogenase [Pseudomonadales bacterium]|jgi:NAD(P)-dependent dehydrogenase (short-subunit alcohol dehydrogenase family)|nr:glucose 1-dehydrogenase [Pseudomonadales bacterium]